jgi:putative ABC transport system permease protein
VPYFSTVIGTVGMSLADMRSWFDRPVTTTLEIAAGPGVDPRRLLADVRRVVPSPDYVYGGRAKLAGLEAPMRQSMFIANAVWIIVVCVAAVALLNTLTLSVLERRRELGVLRAMGSSRRFTVRMVLAEATGIGVVGGVLGLAFGGADQWLFSLVSGDMMNFQVAFRPSWTAFAFCLGALAISLLGSLPPARRAARLNIIEAVSVD